MMKIAAVLCLLGASTACAFVPFTTQSIRNDVSLEMSCSNRRQMLLQSGVIGLTMASALLTPLSAFAEPRPTYLTEPTEEFKQNEQKAMEFRRQQLEQKKKFTAVLDRLQDVSKTEKELVDDLQDLRALVIQTAGLPGGLKKDDVIKQVRAKKAKGFWPTNVEIAYQDLIGEIRFQQSPNTEKDMGNPL